MSEKEILKNILLGSCYQASTLPSPALFLMWVITCSHRMTIPILGDFDYHIDTILSFMHWICYNSMGEIIEVVFPDIVKQIPDNFIGNECFIKESIVHGKKLRRIKLSDSVVSIGDNFCIGCYDIIEFKNSVKLKSVGKDFLYFVEKLEEVKFSDELETIGEFFLAYTLSLKRLTFSRNVKHLPGYSFFSCISLKHIEPSGILIKNKLGEYHLALNGKLDIKNSLCHV